MVELKVGSSDIIQSIAANVAVSANRIAPAAAIRARSGRSARGRRGMVRATARPTQIAQ